MKLKLYFKEAQQKTVANIEELLILGYVDAEKDHYYGFAPTYFDAECTVQQCKSARRSFDDLLIICKTYFPRTTKKHLAKALYKLHTKDIYLSIFICGDIKKVVFSRVSNYQRFTKYFLRDVDSNRYDGMYDPNKKGNGNHSFNDIIKLIGLKHIKYENNNFIW